MNWQYIVAGAIVVAGIFLFFYLATRKHYRDPSAAQNYEKIRNKLTTRDLEVEEDEEPVEGSGALSSVVSIFGAIIGLGIMVMVSVSIMGQLNSSVANMTAAGNVTTALTEQVSLIGSFFPVMIAIMILMSVVFVIFRFIRGSDAIL